MRDLLDPSTPCLWLDDHAYAARLFANDAPSLLDIADYVAFRRQAAALLKSDVTLVVLDRLCSAWVREHPDLVAAMGEKKRAVAPLRALLGEQPLRAHLVATVTALRRAFPDKPLVIMLPSPRAWFSIAREQAGVEAVAVGQPEADSASVYVAEFLRAFGECELQGVALAENADDAPGTTDEIAWYQPVFNVASHFRWKTGIVFRDQSSPEGVPGGVDFVIAPSALGGVVTLLSQPPSLWSGDSAAASAEGPFVYAEIPRDAQPERVLAVIEALRKRHGA